MSAASGHHRLDDPSKSSELRLEPPAQTKAAVEDLLGHPTAARRASLVDRLGVSGFHGGRDSMSASSRRMRLSSAVAPKAPGSTVSDPVRVECLEQQSALVLALVRGRQVDAGHDVKMGDGPAAKFEGRYAR